MDELSLSLVILAVGFIGWSMTVIGMRVLRLPDGSWRKMLHARLVARQCNRTQCMTSDAIQLLRSGVLRQAVSVDKQGNWRFRWYLSGDYISRLLS